MSNNNQYKYENESSIHSKLICTICLSPFNKPVSTRCGHTFCICCIQQWLEEKSSCPICRHILAENYYTNIINQNILEEVNQLEVKCTLCEQNNIKRQDFDYHVNHQCTKAVISCPAADKQCSWTGQRKDLPAHEKICCYRQNQRILGDESKQNKIRVRKLMPREIFSFFSIFFSNYTMSYSKTGRFDSFISTLFKNQFE